MKTFWLRQVPVGGWVSGRFLSLVGLAGLFFLGGCEYELPAQPTIFVTKKTPDSLGELLKNPASHQGHIAVLGGANSPACGYPCGKILFGSGSSVGRKLLSDALPAYSHPEAPGRYGLCPFCSVPQDDGGNEAGYEQGKERFYRVRSA